MQASNNPTSPMDSGFISGDFYAAIHVDLLSDYLLDDISDVIDMGVRDGYRDLLETANRDPDWAPVSDYLYANVNKGELAYMWGGGDDVADYVETLEFGGVDSAPKPLLRNKVARAADDINQSLRQFMREEVALG